MLLVFRLLWVHDEGQDVAEYAIMLAVVILMTVGAVQVIDFGAGTVFSSVGSAIQQ